MAACLQGSRFWLLGLLVNRSPTLLENYKSQLPLYFTDIHSPQRLEPVDFEFAIKLDCHRRITFLVRGEMSLQLICSIANWSWMTLLSWITQIGKCTWLLIYLFGSLVKCGNHCNMFSFVSLVHCAGQIHQHKAEVESLLCKHRHHKLSAVYPSCIRRQVLLLSIEYLSSHPVQLVLHSCHSGCRLALQLDF